MRKLKEVLRLHSLGLSQHQIARSCWISQSTVHEYLSAAQAAGVQWPLAENWGDGEIERALFPARPVPAVWRKHPEPSRTGPAFTKNCKPTKTLPCNWSGRNSGRTTGGYAYSRFCDLYRRWVKKLDLVLRQEHRAGEKMFVDYAGATIPIYDPEGGEPRQAAVFVAVLGASGYTFAEATSGQDLRNWIGSHIRAWEFFGGVTDCRVAGAAGRANVPQAAGQSDHAVRATGSAGAEAAAGCALPVLRMGNRPRQHRLSRRGGSHFYSVPYAMVHQEVDVHLTRRRWRFLHRGVRVASHLRSYVPAKAATLTEHRPKSHQRYGRATSVARDSVRR